MAHAQKPDFFFLRNGRVHLNLQGCQFSRLLAAEVCASAIILLDVPCSEVVWRVLATQSIRQFPLHFPSRASPCAIMFRLDFNSYYFSTATVVTWTRHNITLYVHCLSCYFIFPAFLCIRWRRMQTFLSGLMNKTICANLAELWPVSLPPPQKKSFLISTHIIFLYCCTLAPVTHNSKTIFLHQGLSSAMGKMFFSSRKRANRPWNPLISYWLGTNFCPVAYSGRDVKLNSHSPSLMLRISGPLLLLPPMYREFNCKPNPDARRPYIFACTGVLISL